MTFVPHISVITKPGHEEGASVSVSFAKEIVSQMVEVEGFRSVIDERRGPELEAVTAEIAHGVAKMLHETLELEAKLREEEIGYKAQEVESFLGEPEVAVGDQRMGEEDTEGDANALADASSFNEQLTVENAWYRHIIHQVLHGFVVCQHCKAVIEVHRNAQGIASSNCVVCGGIGYLEKREDGSLVKYNLYADPVDNPPGFKKPLMPESEQFQTVDDAVKLTDIQLLCTKMTDRALETVANATKEAQRLKQPYVGTQHLLAALARGGNSVAATALNNLHIDLKDVRIQINAVAGGLGDAVSPPEGYTPHAKDALMLAEAERVKMGHTRIGTEHILLGVVKRKEAAAEQILNNLGSSCEGVTKEIYALLGYDPNVEAK